MNPPGRVSRLLALLAGAASLCAQPVIAATGSGGAPPITVSFQAFWSAAQGRPFAPAAPDLPAAAVGLLAAGRGPAADARGAGGNGTLSSMATSGATLRLTGILAAYGRFHRDPRNRRIHYFGVPAIIYSLLIPATLHVDTVAGVPLPLDRVIVALAAVGYILLDAWLGLSLTLALALLAAAAEATAALGPAYALAIAAAVFVLGWALQLLGHRLEGNRPALQTNLAQILVAPLFLTAELGFSLGLRRGLRGDVERRLGGGSAT